MTPISKHGIAVAALAAVLAAGLAVASYFNVDRTRLIELPEEVQGAARTIARGGKLPRPAHVVVLIEENKSYEQIVGDTANAAYINQLAARAALFTESYGVAHPSQPNYFALFAGVTNSNGDACAVRGVPADGANLGAQVLASHRPFVAYAEDLPAAGFRGCTAGNYARKHAPWTHFDNVPAVSIQPFTAFPASDYGRLPAVAFIVPNELNDMHSGSIARGDAWLRRVISPLEAWAKTHDTLIVVTWDESSTALSNHILTLFLGPMVKPGRYTETVTHDTVLRTIEDLYGLAHAGSAAVAQPLIDIWR